MFVKRNLSRLVLTTLCMAAAAATTTTTLASPGRDFSRKSEDAGPAASSTQITSQIILNVNNLPALRNYVLSTVTPGDPNFHHFLTVEQFSDNFAPSEKSIQQLVKYLRSYGITVDKIYRDHLDITISGTAAQINAAFSTQERMYQRDGKTFYRPAWKYSLPGNLGQMVLSVPGLSSEPASFHPMIARLGHGAYQKMVAPNIQWPHSGTASGVPGDYTVGDVANFYNINPLYQEGVTGRNQTIGIMTLANFRRADVYAYWNAIGLKVKPNRVSKVMVDGGTPVAANVGDDETSLDVEQSGGIAPDARIQVYIAPNTNQGFLDLFYTAASKNRADTVSISWGEPEELYFAALNGGTDYTGQLIAMDQALLEGAAQGQSFFAAAGDAGAYDINNAQIAPIPQYSEQLSVDAPASDPTITAAGGLTINATIPGIASLGCPAIPIAQQQVWGWDYLLNAWGSCLGLTTADLFPVGGGGGVSSFWSMPSYQRQTMGMQRTQPGQSLYQYPNPPSTVGGTDLIDLPANFLGRNVPDLSLNADPETGYVLIDCTDFPAPANPQCAAAGFGGTSFVAPQLNGMTALIDQASGGRVGLLNPTLYALQNELGYGRGSPFMDVTAGDNWFYHGLPGYDDGSGIGAINVARLALIYSFLNGADDSHEGNHH